MTPVCVGANLFNVSIFITLALVRLLDGVSSDIVPWYGQVASGWYQERLSAMAVGQCV